jgi:hypothetical protein
VEALEPEYDYCTMEQIKFKLGKKSKVVMIVIIMINHNLARRRTMGSRPALILQVKNSYLHGELGGRAIPQRFFDSNLSRGVRRGVSKEVEDGRMAVSGVAFPQGVEGLGMAGLGETIGNP